MTQDEPFGVDRLVYEPPSPYSLERTVERFTRFPDVVDLFEEGVYRRLIPVGRGVALVAVRQTGSVARAVLEVEIRGRGTDRETARIGARRMIERVLGAGQDVRPFYRALAADRWLKEPIRRFRGLRIAGTGSLWEALVTAVLFQQIRLAFAYSIRRELALALGRRARFDGRTFMAFPTPAAILRAESSLRTLRLSRAKAAALGAIARGFQEGAISEERIADLPEEEAVERLTAFSGIGRWSAEIALLRGLGRVDTFPAADLGVVRYIAEGLLGRDGKASEAEMRQFAERWRPYRGFALVYAYAELARRKAEKS